jgi:hypothetical protein
MDKLAFVLGYTEGLDQLAKIAAGGGVDMDTGDRMPVEGPAPAVTKEEALKARLAEQDRAAAVAKNTAKTGVAGAIDKAKAGIEGAVDKTKAGIAGAVDKAKTVGSKAIPSKEALMTIGKYLGTGSAGAAIGGGAGYLAGDTGIGAGAGAGIGAALPKAIPHAMGGNWKAKALASLLTAGAGGAGAGAGYGVEQAVS